jgi:hypothetical protein
MTRYTLSRTGVNKLEVTPKNTTKDDYINIMDELPDLFIPQGEANPMVIVV